MISWKLTFSLALLSADMYDCQSSQNSPMSQVCGNLQMQSSLILRLDSLYITIMFSAAQCIALVELEYALHEFIIILVLNNQASSFWTDIMCNVLCMIVYR